MGIAEVYGTSPIKRTRRTKAEIQGIRDAIFHTLENDNPMTVRQVFYQLVFQGVVAKKESEYKNTVDRLLIGMRRSGLIPFRWISDNTRWMRRPRTFSSAENALEECARTYRRNLWDDQDAYVEVWLEKDALAGVLYEETKAWGVPLMVTRGFSSLTFLHSAAEAIAAQRKPAHIYYFGDYDPSGIQIDRTIERSIREWAPRAVIHFERVAVLPGQIQSLNLPTRPTKGKKKVIEAFGERSVEVDAIPPSTLRQLARHKIEQHVDLRKLEHTRFVEKQEREALRLLQFTKPA